MITAAQGGDRDAFGQLYTRYAPEVARFVGPRVGGNRPLVEDLTSETFTRALGRIGSVCDQGRDVGAWFTTIARNLITDHYKSSRTKRERATADPRHQALAVLDDHSPERAVLQRETAREVLRAVAGLRSAAQRESIRLRFLQERSVAETAEVMGRAPGAVKSLTHRALEGLRAQLAADAERAPVPPETTDPMAGARRAVALAHQRIAATTRRATDHHEDERAARREVEDQASAHQRADGRGELALAEGVA
ncbi:MAG: sigma-70 family RNA polymerase sigma factor [Pseudonocardiaceae bacterium]